MKKLSLFLSLLVAGCVHLNSQVPPGPQLYTCPPAVVGGTVYVPLNLTAQSTGTTYSDTSSPVTSGGVFCYIEQSYNGTNSSVPSNVLQVTVPVGDQVNLSWTDPVNTSGITGYVTSRAPAVAVSPLAPPVLSTPVVVASLNAPLKSLQMLAKLQKK